MQEFLAMIYLWLKAGHIAFVIFWIAGLFMLPRLFVYHSQVVRGSAQSDMFKVMERRLMRAIINPAMIATVVFGILLLGTPGLIDWSEGWIWVKLALVIVLTGVHGMYSRWRRDLDADNNRHSERFYRRWNEVPMLMAIAIVVMVIVRPF